MEAKARSLTFLATEGIVRIPFFQRAYVWSRPNWEELLDDLADTGRRHFLGSLILKQLPRVPGELSTVLVIDGQQRLTTLSLLLKALHDTLPEASRQGARETLRKILFTQKGPLDASYRVKIEHSHLDARAYRRVITAGIDDPKSLGADETADKGPLAAYRYFVEQLSKWAPDRRAALFGHLCDDMNKMLVVISLDESDDEQAIFDTINSAGVRLSGADIVKNALYQRAIETMSEERALELYDEQWKRTFLADEPTVTFWDRERITGRVTRDNLEILLHAVGVVKHIYDPDAHKLGGLAAQYKRKLELLDSADGVKEFATDLSAYAALYREHFEDVDDTTPLSFSDGVARLLHILDELQISTLHPYVLYVLRQHPASAEARLLELERFVVRRVVAGQETKSLNKLASELVRKPEVLAVRRAETSDEQVKAGLRNLSNKVGRLLLSWIELRRRENQNQDVRELAFTYTLEHILPQQWKPTDWPLPSIGADGSPLSAELAKEERKRRVYSIGNMTLLRSRLNSTLRHASFDKKMNGVGRKKGIRAYADLSITKDDLVVPYEQGLTTWDEARIDQRTLALEKEVLALWGPVAAPSPGA